jgi:putative selenium metabolism protein SsnA
VSLLLVGGTVLSSLEPPVVADADILVDGDRVAAVVSPADRGPVAGGPSPDTIDCHGRLVIPGNVCAHTHLYSALARGMPYELAPPADFLHILRRVWWRLDRALDEESIRAAALVAGLEALRSGTTSVVDHHASPNAIDGSLDIVAATLAEVGIRSVLCYETSDRDGAQRATAGIAENRRFLARSASGDWPLARGMVGAHASFTLSDETLDACVDAANAAACGIHIHVAEDDVDERDAMARSGVRVVERLARAGAVETRTFAAHAVCLDADEARMIREMGALVVHNPRSNMNNAVGRPDLDRLGDRVALGTDGIGADMFGESQAAFFRHRDDGGRPEPDWPLARLARGAEAVGRIFDEPELGRIVPGAPADLVVLDYPAPAPLDANSVAGHWIYALGARHVRDVIVAGRPVLRDGRSTLVDEDARFAEARVQATRLWQRLATIDAHPYAPQEALVR